MKIKLNVKILLIVYAISIWVQFDETIKYSFYSIINVFDILKIWPLTIFSCSYIFLSIKIACSSYCVDLNLERLLVQWNIGCCYNIHICEHKNLNGTSNFDSISVNVHHIINNSVAKQGWYIMTFFQSFHVSLTSNSINTTYQILLLFFYATAAAIVAYVAIESSGIHLMYAAG